MSRLIHARLYLTKHGAVSACLFVALLAALAYYYIFQGTIGTYRALPWNTEYYDLAAEGFRRLQLHLPVEPPAVLLAQPNPYDPVNRAWWMWDAVLWNGHYYIYWGPVPALVLLAYKLLTGSEAKVFDQWLVLVFMLGRLFAGGILIWRLAGRANPRVPSWAALLAVAVFALASPTPFVMARPVIYEASVAAGQCWLFMGLWLAFEALTGRGRGTLYAVLAGIAWGLALNSRVTLLLVAPLLAAASAWFMARRTGGGLPALLRSFLAFGTPVALSVLACAAYNYARFGSPSDFGVAHQLTGRPFFTSLRYFLPNLFSYAGAGLDWSCGFPFVTLTLRRTLSDWIEWPLDYDVGTWAYGERVGGLLVSVPFVWLLGALAWLALARRAVPGVERSVSWARPLTDIDVWAVMCGVATTIALLPALGAYTASMRYLEDASGGLLLAASVAAFVVLRRTPRAAGALRYTLARLVVGGLALYSIGVGVLLGFSGFTENFPRQNPVLFGELAARLSLCTTLPAAPPPIVVPPSAAPPTALPVVVPPAPAVLPAPAPATAPAPMR